MPQSLRLLLGAVCAGLLAAPVAADCARLQPTSQPVTAPGVQYKVLANGLKRPRGITVDSEGNLLVVQKTAGIQRIVLDEAKGLDVCVQSSSNLVPDTKLNHGIALSADGKTLFASSDNDVFAYSYNAATGKAGPGKNLITGMAQTDHVSRTLLIPRHNPNMLIVSRGSNDNVDEGTMDIKSGRSQLRIFDIGKLLASNAPIQYTDGAVLGWGLRNSVGVADHPRTGGIWSVENSLDNMMRGGVDVHESNPGEELNYHGRPNDTRSDMYGKNYGYPQCVSITDPSTVANYPGGAAVGKQMTGDHTAEGHGDDYCTKKVLAPHITFGSHLAPLDLRFLDNGAAALVSMHGSWNRKPPNGYRLSRVDFGYNGFPVEPSTSTKGEVQLMWNADNSNCPGKCFRPVGLALDSGAQGGKNRLFMTSDATGEIFVVTGIDGSLRQKRQFRWTF